MLSVSHFHGAGSGQPSLAMTVMCMPCRCIGWIIIPSFMKRMRTFWPELGDDRLGRREALAVERVAVRAVVEDHHVVDVGLVAAPWSFGSTMNAPSSPWPTCFAALWCEWYMCEPAFGTVNS